MEECFFEEERGALLHFWVDCLVGLQEQDLTHTLLGQIPERLHALLDFVPCQSFRFLCLLYHLKPDRSAPDQKCVRTRN